MLILQYAIIALVILSPIIYQLIRGYRELNKESTINIETQAIIDVAAKIRLARRSTDRIFK